MYIPTAQKRLNIVQTPFSLCQHCLHPLHPLPCHCSVDRENQRLQHVMIHYPTRRWNLNKLNNFGYLSMWTKVRLRICSNHKMRYNQVKEQPQVHYKIHFGRACAWGLSMVQVTPHGKKHTCSTSGIEAFALTNCRMFAISAGTSMFSFSKTSWKTRWLEHILEVTDQVHTICQISSNTFICLVSTSPIWAEFCSNYAFLLRRDW